MSTRSAPYSQFLREYVETFEDLEVTLAVAERRQTGVDVRGLAGMVRLDAPTVNAIVERLHRAGLLVLVDQPTETYAIDWRSPETAAALEALAADYRLERIRVMSELTANALDRVRTAAIRAFAQAFVIRKSGDG